MRILKKLALRLANAVAPKPLPQHPTDEELGAMLRWQMEECRWYCHTLVTCDPDFSGWPLFHRTHMSYGQYNETTIALALASEVISRQRSEIQYLRRELGERGHG